MTDAPQDPQLEPVPEPSVLDYLKSRLFPGRHPRVEISRPSPSPTSRVEGSTVVEQAPETTAASASPMAAEKPQTSPTHPPADKRTFNRLPWRALMALGLALLAQSFYEPPASRATLGSVLYLVAAAVLAWSALRGEWVLAPPPADVEGKDPLSYRRMALIASIPLATLAFLFFGGNLFTRFQFDVVAGCHWAVRVVPVVARSGERLRLAASAPPFRAAGLEYSNQSAGHCSCWRRFSWPCSSVCITSSRPPRSLSAITPRSSWMCTT